MNTLEVLLNRRWILKSQDKELYYQLKDELGEIKDFLVEKLGYQVLVNPYLIKVEKIPAKPERWMGIQEFKEKNDYIFFCYVLMFLEDKEVEEQFVLSALTEYIQSQCKEVQVDWTNYQNRRCLIRIMKYCVQCGILAVDDGTEEAFAKDYTSEVLYENTGASRYYTKNFTQDISKCQRPEELQKEEWIDVNTDRGIVRRQRVYRRLLMSLGFSKTEETEEDFVYARTYRNVIQTDFSKYLDCELQIHKTSAFLIMGEDSRLGRCLPEEHTLSDITLLCFQLFRMEIESGNMEVPVDEQIQISLQQYEQIIERCKERFGAGFVKSYRELTTMEFIKEVRAYMEELELIIVKHGMVYLNPVVGKLIGTYPVDFKQNV